jgi:hypothetical protein
MVRTRAQEKAGDKGVDQEVKATTAKETPKKRTHSKTEASNTSKKLNSNKKAKKEKDDQPAVDKPNKSADSTKSEAAASHPKIKSLIERYGSIPLSDTELEDPMSPKPQTILALLLNAMFSSARISHELAAKTIATAIKADYHKIDTLRKSSWDERTQVLTEGGYTRYREKTATALGELVELIDEKYSKLTAVVRFVLIWALSPKLNRPSIMCAFPKMEKKPHQPLGEPPFLHPLI